MVVEAILHVDRERTANRIEPEQGIVRHQRHAGDRHFRDQIPVHHVTEGFVDAGAILVDSEALHGSWHRRGVEAPVVEAALKLISSLVAQGDEGNGLHHAVKQRRRLRMVKVACIDRLNVGRHFFAIDFPAGYRRNVDNHELRQSARYARCTLVAATFDARLRSGHHDRRQGLNGRRLLGIGEFVAGKRAQRYR
jgi:hypothetical protein